MHYTANYSHVSSLRFLAPLLQLRSPMGMLTPWSVAKTLFLVYGAERHQLLLFLVLLLVPGLLLLGCISLCGHLASQH